MQPSQDTESAPVRSTERCVRFSHDARCNHVIEAAIRVFAQKGFQGTKTKEIAEAAGINEALIFRDFKNKEKLYCAILEYASSRIDTHRWIEELSMYATGKRDDALFSALAAKIFESFGKEPTLFRLMLYCALEQHELSRKFRERQIEPLERFLADYVRTRQADGAFRDVDAHTLGRTFLNICHHHVMRQVLFGAGAHAPDELATARMYTQIFLNGTISHVHSHS
jgi:AcrR family transcriptional regulator